MNKTNSPYRVITGAEQPDLLNQANQKIGAEWPEFMLHDPVANGFDDLYERLPQYQFGLVDRETEEIASIGNSIPLRFEVNVGTVLRLIQDRLGFRPAIWA
jgi:hypothetical protein